MNFDLADFERQLAAIHTDFESLFRDLTDEEANTSPAPGIWSMSEAMGHLDISADAFVAAWDVALEEGHRRGLTQPASPAYPFLLRGFLWYIEPPYRFKVRTGAAFVPLSGSSVESMRDGIESRHAKVLDRARRAVTMDLGAIRVQSPFAKQVKYPIGYSFDLFAAHERRHMWQARRLREFLRLGQKR